MSWEGDHLTILDQTKLPFEEHYIVLAEPESYVKAIREMKLRGAPLLGIVSSYAIAQAGLAWESLPFSEFEARLRRFASRLIEARPTAVNLAWGVQRMLKVLDDNILLEPRTIAKLMVAEAKKIHQKELEAQEKLSRLGASLIRVRGEVITICNTGELATGGMGTALGIIRESFRMNKITRVWVMETRPFIQGRLTAWELAKEKIPFRVVVDGAVGAVMSRFRISYAVVGADRVAANGDFANKIGTYTLAVMCHRHRVPFIVAAPRSTFDENCASGEEIQIEERSGDEVRKFGRSFVLPKNYPTFNPAFDVTPAELVSYYVSEDGIKAGKRAKEEEP